MKVISAKELEALKLRNKPSFTRRLRTKTQEIAVGQSLFVGKGEYKGRSYIGALVQSKNHKFRTQKLSRGWAITRLK